jgi:hypothetical protein
VSSKKHTPKAKKSARPPKPPIVPHTPNQTLAPHVSIEHQKLMARAIMAWSKFEAALHDFIWTALNLEDDDGRILTKSVGAKMLIPMARSLGVRHAMYDDISALEGALDLADGRREDRDFIAHGLWSTLMPDNVPMAMSMKPNAPPETVTTETFPADRMRAIASDIIQARDVLLRTRNALAASRGKPPLQRHTGPLSPPKGRK